MCTAASSKNRVWTYSPGKLALVDLRWLVIVGVNYIISYEDKVICYQLELGKQLADILTECSSHHQGKSDDDWSIQLKHWQVIF